MDNKSPQSTNTPEKVSKECEDLRNELKIKELKLYENQLRISDLQSEINHYIQLKEKLNIANRNARLLEEENNNLITQLKDANLVPAVAPGAEAISLIKKNEELSDAFLALKNKSEVDSTSSQGKIKELERILKELAEEKERLSHELEKSRRQCVDMKKSLDEKSFQLNAYKRQQNNDNSTDLMNISIPHSEGKTTMRNKERNDEHPLRIALLQEEVQQLEKKMKEKEERIWSKEKEWKQTEIKLLKKIDELQNTRQDDTPKTNDSNVYRALRDQIEIFKREIALLRNERKQKRPFSLDVPMSPKDENEDFQSEKEAISCGFRSGNTRRMRPEDESNEVELLQEENDQLRQKIMNLQNVLEAKEIEQKEADARSTSQRALPSGNEITSFGNDYPINGGETDLENLKQELAMLKKKHSTDIEYHHQKENDQATRMRSLEDRIQQLLSENEQLKQHPTLSRTTDNVSTLSPFSIENTHVSALSRDKRESVEDVMRALEAAWASEEEKKNHLRILSRQCSDYAAALASNSEARNAIAMEDSQERMNRDSASIRRYQAQLRDREERIGLLEDELRNRDHALRNIENRLSETQSSRRGSRGKAFSDDSRQKDAQINNMSKELESLRETNHRLSQKLTTTKQVTPRASERNSPSKRVFTPVRAHRTNSPALSTKSSEEVKRATVPAGAHLAVTVVELAEIQRNGRPITEPGYIVIKVKSVKEKYKTTIKELAPVVRFDETFVFYLAQPNRDVITLHIYYKAKGGSREYHIGDAAFSMATLHRGITRERIAPVAQDPGTAKARRAGVVAVLMRSDDFGYIDPPTREEIDDETVRFHELVRKLEVSMPENLHSADVVLASSNNEL